jgi:plastocyanin
MGQDGGEEVIMKIKKNFWIGVIILIALIILGFLIFKYAQNPSDKNPVVGPSGPQTFNVIINGSGFYPSSLTVSPGDTVIWTNRDVRVNTVTSNFESELSSKSLYTEDTYSHIFDKQGDFVYHSELHPLVNGSVHVEQIFY